MILGVVGYSDSGKTTLVGRLVGILRERGIKVCTIKHVQESSLSPDGKDTTRHLEAGASMTVGVSQEDMVAYFPGGFSLEKAIDVIEMLESPEVILVEGFKGSSIPKVVLGELEAENVVAKGTEDELFESALSYILNEVKIETVMSKLAGLDCGKCGHANCRQMATAIVEGKAKVAGCRGLGSRTRIELDGESIGVNSFVGEMIGNTLEGMVKALKGSGNPREILIRVRLNPSSQDESGSSH